MAIVATLYNRSASSPSARPVARVSRTKWPTSSGVLGLDSVRRTQICRQPKLPKCRRKSEMAPTSRSVIASLRWSGRRGCVRLHERAMGSSRKGKHETAIIDEEDQVDSLVALAYRSPEPLPERRRARELDAQPRGLHRRGGPGPRGRGGGPGRSSGARAPPKRGLARCTTHDPSPAAAC